MSLRFGIMLALPFRRLWNRRPWRPQKTGFSTKIAFWYQSSDSMVWKELPVSITSIEGGGSGDSGTDTRPQ